MTEGTHTCLFTNPQSGFSKGFNIASLFGSSFVVAGIINAQATKIPVAYAISAQAGIHAIVTLVLVRLYGRVSLRDLLKAMNRGTSLRRSICWGAVGAFTLPFAMASLEAFLRMLGHAQITAPQWITQIAHNRNALLVTFLVSGGLVPAVEEILYRGVLMGWLEKRFSGSIALIGSAFIFAAAHFNPSTLPHLVVIGLVFGFVCQKSRGIASSIIAHSFWNTLTLFLSIRGHA